MLYCDFDCVWLWPKYSIFDCDSIIVSSLETYNGDELCLTRERKERAEKERQEVERQRERERQKQQDIERAKEVVSILTISAVVTRIHSENSDLHTVCCILLQNFLPVW